MNAGQKLTHQRENKTSAGSKCVASEILFRFSNFNFCLARADRLGCSQSSILLMVRIKCGHEINIWAAAIESSSYNLFCSLLKQYRLLQK